MSDPGGDGTGPVRDYFLSGIKEVFSMQETRLPEIIQENLQPSNPVERMATLTTGYTPDLERELQEEPSYYDYPVLKAPVWRWEIIWYFFFGGLAACCYVIATIASLFGSKEDRAVVRTGYYLSLLAVFSRPPPLLQNLARPPRLFPNPPMFDISQPPFV